jgi:hypothetical protein
MSFLLIMFSKTKLVARLFWLLLLCADPLGQSATTPLLLCIVTSSSARYVSATNAVCRSIGIFNNDCILLTDISQLFKSK